MPDNWLAAPHTQSTLVITHGALRGNSPPPLSQRTIRAANNSANPQKHSAQQPQNASCAKLSDSSETHTHFSLRTPAGPSAKRHTITVTR